MLDFTVAIPTYNGAERLPLVLDCLQAQVGVEGLNWEIIVVDNNSSDRTAQVIRDYQVNWSHAYPLKYCLETRQGPAFARQRAVEMAAGCYVAFLDDDNLPDVNWLASAFAFGEQYPRAAALSGRIRADYEIEPPDNFSRIAQFLAIRDRGNKPLRFEPEKLQLPPSAGLVVRREIWLDTVPAVPAIAGSQGSILVRGEDYEALLYMHKAGWEIWYNPEMSITHIIPSWRLQKKYLMDLARSCGLATYQLRLILASPAQVPLIFIRTILGNVKRIMQQVATYGWRIKTDLAAGFELQFYYSSLLSPFYYYLALFKTPVKANN